jgi:hypothetical protein
LSWSVFASLEKDQYIHYAKGFDGEFIREKTRRQIHPGSLLFMLGNTLHAGTKFEGSKIELEQQLRPDQLMLLSNYKTCIGDLRVFYDVEGRGNGMVREESRDQKWCFEKGNKYGKAVGYSDMKVLGNLEICLANDAAGDGCCLDELQE